MAERSVIDFLSYNIYLTRWKETEVKHLVWDQNVTKHRRGPSSCDGWFICLFALAGSTLPSSPRGRKRSNHRPQAEDSLWKAKLGQRVYQYCIKAPGVSTMSHCFPLTYTRIQAEKVNGLRNGRSSGQD